MTEVDIIMIAQKAAKGQRLHQKIVGTITTPGCQGLGYKEAKRSLERDKILQEVRKQKKTREEHTQLHKRNQVHGLTGVEWETTTCHGRNYRKINTP